MPYDEQEPTLQELTIQSRTWVREQTERVIAEGRITGRFCSVYDYKPGWSVVGSPNFRPA